MFMALDSDLAQTVAQIISNKIKSSTKSTKPEDSWKIAVDEIFKAIRDHAELDVKLNPISVPGPEVTLVSLPTGGPVSGVISPIGTEVKGTGTIK
jgi:hypothetical protein